ncbi:MAG: hypothetical protein K2Q09_01885, partial [Phycisphaerales bacterium]|nr:hypothetical protein [Phycisphaerales bacterium]
MTVRRSAATLATLAVASPLLAAPPNDARSNAVPVSLGNSYNGTTAQASNAGDTSGACGSSYTAPDVWYRLDTPANTGVSVSLCGSSYDTVVQVFGVGPGNTLGPSIVCNDDSCNYQSTVDFSATGGLSYWVRVAGYGGATGTFTVALSATVAMPPLPPAPARSSGPDVTIGDLSDLGAYTTGAAGSVWTASSAVVGTSGGWRAFSIGTNSWNIGDIPLEWQAGNQLHPNIAQQMYRWKDGRFEQIRISWLKHGFASTNSSDFPDLGTCDQPPSGGAQLGVNCADLYGSSLNGGRSYLGPRFDVNPTTGVFTYPWNPLVGPTPSDASDPVSRRLVVADADVQPAQNAGARYFVDCRYTTQDDAQWNNGLNNYSARLLAGSNFMAGGGFTGSTYRRTTALELYTMMDPDALLSAVDFHEQTGSVVDKWRHWTQALPDAAPLSSNQWVTLNKGVYGRFLVGSKANDNGNGTWDYEYAVMNLNSQRAGGSFAVRLPAGASVTNLGFHAPVYHSGDRVLNNPWTNNAGADGRVRWDVNPATANVQVPGMSGTRLFSPNALMWGTLYNFRFTSAAAPSIGVARIGLFRAPASTAAGFQGDSLAVTGLKVPTVCTADVGSQGGLTGPDGSLDNNDFIVFISSFFNADAVMADVGQQGGLTGP